MLKTLFKKFFITKKEKMALILLNGMISADWNLPIPEGYTWDDIAIDRAFLIADKIISK
jgi:hypothetical protein